MRGPHPLSSHPPASVQKAVFNGAPTIFGAVWIVVNYPFDASARVELAVPESKSSVLPLHYKALFHCRRTSRRVRSPI